MDVKALSSASRLLDARQYARAIKLCSRALSREPECVPLLLVRARACIALGYTIDARTDLRDVIRIDPHCKTAYQLLRELAAPARQKYPTTEQVWTIRESDEPRTIARELPIPPRRLARGSIAGPIPAPGVKFGRYEVFEKLGHGGMASVHRAELEIGGLRRQVALKRLHPRLAEDREFVEAFVNEARLANRLRHPNIPTAHELGKIDGTYYFAMEYVGGQALMDLMSEARLASRPVPLPAAVELFVQLCDALVYAHELRDDAGRPLGLMHRDISPANVMVSGDGVVKLIDFGIAKSATSEDRTKTGIIKGKLAYIAPEYVSGRLDARGDLFAFGVIAHELLAGRRLFLANDDYATLWNVCEKPIEPPSRWNPSIPIDLDDIVLTALERDPDQRWQSARALRTALLNLARDLDVCLDGSHLRRWACSSRGVAPTEPGDPSISIEVRDEATMMTATALEPDPRYWADPADNEW